MSKTITKKIADHILYILFILLAFKFTINVLKAIIDPIINKNLKTLGKEIPMLFEKIKLTKNEKKRNNNK